MRSKREGVGDALVLDLCGIGLEIRQSWESIDIFRPIICLIRKTNERPRNIRRQS